MANEWWLNADRGRYENPANIDQTMAANNSNNGMAYQSSQGAGNYYPDRSGIASVNVPQEKQKYFSDSSQMVYPGSAYSPQRDFEEMQFSEQVQQPKKKNLLNRAFSALQSFTPTGMLMKQFTEKPQHTFNKEYFAGEGQPGIYDGRIGGLGGGADNVFGGKNAVYGFGPELEVGAQKRISGLQNTIDKMMAGDAWTQLQENDPKKFDAKLKRLQNKHRLFTQQLAQYNKGVAADEKAKIDAQRATTLQADRAAGSHRDTVQLDPGGGGGPGKDSQTWHGQTAAKERQGKQVAGPGFGKGSYFNQGGRAGYENGELVTDESMMEATPAGMMQENVEEVQGEPSREQLEALAMEIFQLPLEELNEEQLMIVYQAAMEQQPREEMMQEEDIQFADRGQPMEEDIQQEDIQYAAGGGRIGLRYGGLVSLL